MTRNPEEDDLMVMGAPLPRLAEAEPLDGRRVRLLWMSGETAIVDLAPILASRRIYASLLGNEALFRGLRIAEWGNALQWDGDLEISAVWLHRAQCMSCN